jgi:hypothetical protein
MHLSARAPGPAVEAGAGYHRILKLARTVADLAGSERIQPAPGQCVASPKGIAEAIHLRPAAKTGVSYVPGRVLAGQTLPFQTHMWYHRRTASSL